MSGGIALTTGTSSAGTTGGYTLTTGHATGGRGGSIAVRAGTGANDPNVNLVGADVAGHGAEEGIGGLGGEMAGGDGVERVAGRA